MIASRRIFAGVFTLLFLWWFLPWVPNVFNQPYAGTLEVSAVQQAAEYLRQKSVLNETVLTASTIIPLLAGISPAYQISHPAWIDPTFRGEVDERFDLIHDPIAEDLAQDLVPWVIDEKLTTDTFRRHSGIDSLLMENFEVVAIIENGLSKPITILRIKEDQ